MSLGAFIFYTVYAVVLYMLCRGYGLTRFLRANITEEAGIWGGDTVYTISSARPGVLNKSDAEIVAANLTVNKNTDGVRD